MMCKMGSNLLCHALFLWLLSCQMMQTMAESNLQLYNTTDTNVTRSISAPNASFLESSEGNTNSNGTQNSSILNGPSSLSPKPEQTATNLNNSPTIGNDEVSKLSSLPDWTPPENFTNFNKSDLIKDKMEKHSNFENRSSAHYFHDAYQGEEDVQTYSVNKKSSGANKLLALFLGMAGVLVCLLILVYCIYSRQHKEDMFSHHRLHGEGFEDPVLHLDTPVDHFDFFSFRDTDLTPAQTPQLKYIHMSDSKPPKEAKAEVPKGTSSNEHLKQVINLGILIDTPINKNFT
ncbi:Golgi-associated olfactory signaling regulator [Discoglossus pictus]